ncbi:MAG: saccharopine dehydrogenase C-terminal domain-containing protein [Bacteroidota bacterium]
MKNVLILGAGMVANPIIKYLLQKKYNVTVAAMNVEEAQKMVAGFPNGKAMHWLVDDEATLDKLVREHDIAVSLLPYVYHLKVANACLKNKKNMVTTSYVKPEMKALDSEVRAAGLIFINEMGLDPGIDHMSAMRIIDHVHAKGGKVEEFYSLCGALPAPEAAGNPFRYKFSWSPKGVVLAGNNDAQFLRHGETVCLPTKDLFKNPMSLEFPDLGSLDIYPNRDSIAYRDIYGIPEAQTVYRGTFRYKGWCETLDAMKAMQLITPEKFDFSGKSYAGFVAMMIGSKGDNIRTEAAAFLDIPVTAHALDAMEWLGLFSHEPMKRTTDSPFEITSDLMLEKMMLPKEERDMVAMMHIFRASYPDGTQEVIKSRMLDFGVPGADTAIARTVALPAAIGVEMILEGKILEKGVHIPVLPGIYKPVLDQLETLNIRMVEEYGLPLSANLG